MRGRRQRGFTLLEAIVTLVIAALIVTVLMQALQHALGLRTRLLRHERESRMADLQEAWFRDSVAGALFDLPDALGPLRGDGSAVEFTTAATITGGPYVARVRWWIEPVDGGVALRHDPGDGRAVTIVAGPLLDARFAYLDASGEWRGAWSPPTPDAPRGEDETPALPRAVRFSADAVGGGMQWLVAVPADPAPAVRLRPEDVANAF